MMCDDVRQHLRALLHVYSIRERQARLAEHASDAEWRATTQIGLVAARAALCSVVSRELPMMLIDGPDPVAMIRSALRSAEAVERSVVRAPQAEVAAWHALRGGTKGVGSA